MLPVLLFTAASVPNPVSANEHSGSSNHTPDWIVHCTEAHTVPKQSILYVHST